MDQQKRLFLAIGLSFGLTIVFTNFVWKPQMEAEKARLDALDAGAQAAALLVDAGAPEVPVIAAQQLDADGGVIQAPQPPAEVPLRTVNANRESMKLTFSSQGAIVSDAVLLGKREHEHASFSIIEGWKKLFGTKFPDPQQMDLAEPPNGLPGPFSIGIAGGQPLSAQLKYAVTEEAPTKVVFTGTEGTWQLTKTYTWAEKGSELTLDVDLKNIGAQPASGELMVNLSRAIDPAKEEKASLFGGIGNAASIVCRHEDSVARKMPDDDKPLQEEKGPLSFVGIDQQYFLSAIWPKDKAIDGRCILTATTPSRLGQLAMNVTVQPQETLHKSFGIYMGPKDFEPLAKIGTTPDAAGDTFAPQLETTVDFGWWAVICKGLLFFLRFFHGLFGNWGFSIIALTVMVKLLLLPLTHKAMVSADAMKKLQPTMEAIRTKWADDRDKQNQEMMKLYSEEKVNPVGGCLPLFLQLPIWAALFTTLRTSYELYGEPFIGPVWSDLTQKDPTYILPLALGVTMIITQRLQPQMMDKSQVFLMTWIMPIFFTAMMMNYPAGLALYIFTNNLLSIIQQFALRRYIKSKEEAAGLTKVNP